MHTFKYAFTREKEGRPNSEAISIISCQALACILASYIFRPNPRGGLPPKVSRLAFLSPHIPETKANFPRSVGPFPSPRRPHYVKASAPFLPLHKSNHTAFPPFPHCLYPCQKHAGGSKCGETSFVLFYRSERMGKRRVWKKKHQNLTCR